jgi:hypothetical protein
VYIAAQRGTDVSTYVQTNTSLQVRTCAQKVIDNINESYKTEKNDLENRYGAICSQMQVLAAQSTLGAHLSAHLGSNANDAAADNQKPVLPRPFHV